MKEGRVTKIARMNGTEYPDLIGISINLLVVYRESVNLIGYITRRLAADSQQL